MKGPKEIPRFHRRNTPQSEGLFLPPESGRVGVVRTTWKVSGDTSVSTSFFPRGDGGRDLITVRATECLWLYRLQTSSSSTSLHSFPPYHRLRWIPLGSLTTRASKGRGPASVLAVGRKSVILCRFHFPETSTLIPGFDQLKLNSFPSNGTHPDYISSLSRIFSLTPGGTPVSLGGRPELLHRTGRDSPGPTPGHRP